jgi:hypothetical protein
LRCGYLEGRRLQDQCRLDQDIESRSSPSTNKVSNLLLGFLFEHALKRTDLHEGLGSMISPSLVTKDLIQQSFYYIIKLFQDKKLFILK